MTIDHIPGQIMLDFGSAGRPELAPAAVNLRAADRISRNGLAHRRHCQPIPGVDVADWPMDPMGAIAFECGLHPDVWEDDRANQPGLAAARAAVDLLVLYRGQDPTTSPEETLGGWADGALVTVVASEMRAAARQAVAP
jgi:hypothetical protein